MKKQVYRINENGFYIEPVIVNDIDDIPIDCIDVDIPQGLYRAKWTGTEWVEDMTQEEIDELNNIARPPTIEEQLAKKDEQILELKQQQVAMNRTVETNSTSQQELIELLIDMGVL